jgi:hypothetical protein
MDKSQRGFGARNMKPKIVRVTQERCDIYYWKCKICDKYFVSKSIYHIEIDKYKHIPNCKGVLSQWLI